MSPAGGSSHLGTLAGLAAILLWSALARLTAWAGGLPPFEMVVLTFAIGAATGALAALLRGRPILAAARRSPGALLLAVAGLFGYHALYFAALAAAPPAEASLIAYLWPLLIVLLAGLRPGGRLAFRHALGALLGFAGAGLLIVGTGGEWAPRAGHLLALGCALVWSGYSVLNRRFAEVPTEAVIVAAAAVAVIALPFHLLLEPSVLPGPAAALAVLALGLGPVGIAFMLWDYGTKHGDLALLGVLSYLAPLLSTALLVATGAAPATPRLAVAAVLVAGGAAMAALGGQRPGPSRAAAGGCPPRPARE